MAIYIRRNDTSYGPYPIEQVRDFIAQGMLQLNDMAQVQGESHWRPLHEIPDVHFTPPPVMHPAFEMPGEATDAVDDGPQIRPWVRYWARTFDILLFSISFGLVFVIVAPDVFNAPGAERALDFVSMILWIPIEAAFISTFGATAGKALLRVKVTNPDGRNLSYPQALSRSFNVWLRGLGIGIPLVSLIAAIIGYQTLTNSGKTSWDRNGGYRVRHQKIGGLRVTLLIAGLVGFFVLMGIGLWFSEGLEE